MSDPYARETELAVCLAWFMERYKGITARGWDSGEAEWWDRAQRIMTDSVNTRIRVGTTGIPEPRAAAHAREEEEKGK